MLNWEHTAYQPLLATTSPQREDFCQACTCTSPKLMCAVENLPRDAYRFPRTTPNEEATAEAQLSNAPFFTGAAWERASLTCCLQGGAVRLTLTQGKMLKCLFGESKC